MSTSFTYPYFISLRPKMRIGIYTIYSIESGCFSLDGGALYGIIPMTIDTCYRYFLYLYEFKIHAIYLIQKDNRQKC